MLKFAPDSNGYERLAFGAILVPDTLNHYGDFHTKQSVRDFAYGFMLNGFRIDVGHDNVDVGDKVRVVESYLAKAGDPDFAEGTWVVGIHVLDDTIWQAILDGNLNGFSYEALVSALPVAVATAGHDHTTGSTYPDPFDGHTHEFVVMFDADGEIVGGGTDVVQNHSHKIGRYTYTERSANIGGNNHAHRYRAGVRKDGQSDTP